MRYTAAILFASCLPFCSFNVHVSALYNSMDWTKLWYDSTFVSLLMYLAFQVFSKLLAILMQLSPPCVQWLCHKKCRYWPPRDAYKTLVIDTAQKFVLSSHTTPPSLFTTHPEGHKKVLGPVLVGCKNAPLCNLHIADRKLMYIAE